MRVRKFKKYAADFETTVYKGQEDTAVWAAACVELQTEEVHVFHSIAEQWDYFREQNCNLCVYYHNLKFDGSFWLHFLMEELKYEPALEKWGTGRLDVQWQREKDMPNKSYKYSITDRGQWYTITIKVNNKVIEIRDSLKLLPFSLERIGKAFQTKHRKLTMEYTGFRFPGCDITPEEQEYIGNDVLVLKEALEFMEKQGHDKLTIGSCCLSEYKKIIGKDDWNTLFPNVYELWIDEKKHGAANVGDYVRKGYKGGWCYLVKGCENKIYRNGTTADVNSLYPSVMSGESGNIYPVGVPHFWTGNMIPREAIAKDKFYYVRIRCRFHLKEGYLPFIQIKGSWLYKGNECLESSDIYDKKTGKYSRYYQGFDGEQHDSTVELTLTMMDYELFMEHYHAEDLEILDGCWFHGEVGLFDEYISRYRKIKETSKGAMRELAKLFLNNLYGKLAMSTDSGFKIAYLKADGSLGYEAVDAHDKTPGYIPAGAAVTSYARCFTIRAAQKNYHGKGRPGFKYADTDSIHCDLPPGKIKGIKVHDTKFLCWKLEAGWDRAVFARQKTYIEHVTQENLKPIDEPYYNIKCAGMGKRPKELLNMALTGEIPEAEKLLEDEQEFLSRNITMQDFHVGLSVPGNLKARNIKGGVLLVRQDYQMR